MKEAKANKVKAMVIKAIFLFSIFSVLASFPNIHGDVGVQLQPHWFKGNVTVNDGPAPDGTAISAKIEGIEYSNTTTISGKYGADGDFYVPDPDLVIIEKYEEWINKTNRTYRVHYTIKNIGNNTAPAGHNTTLFVDGVEIEFKPVPVPLSPEETYSDQFDTILTCTPPLDFIVVRADGNNTVDELNETNNNDTNTVVCPEPPPNVVENCTEQGGNITAWDKCNNGSGYSVPGPAGGDKHCTCDDCCNWYQTSHIHDLGSIISKSDLIVEYMPGYYHCCVDNVTIETSPDNVSWTTIATFATHSVDECPEKPDQCWKNYTRKIHDVTNFRYVNITIPKCFNDYSAAYACYKEEEGIWYNKSGYPNYAPSGMPDFDQKQDNWKNLSTLQWSFCGPTAVANCFWWFDSKYADPNGTPGDGKDAFSLVSNYNAPNPWWGSDDHDPSNVDDLATPWPNPPNGGELIERLALCMDCDGSRTGIPHSGTKVSDMENCIDDWLNDTGLNNTLYEHTEKKPSFEYIVEEVNKSQNVILLLGFWENQSGYWKRIGGHYVTVSGVNSEQRMIAFSDPCFDISNLATNETWHNNASNVSHDSYKVLPNSSSPGGDWWIEDYYDPFAIEYYFKAMNVPAEWEEYQAEEYRGTPIHTEIEYAVVISPKCSIEVNKTVWNATTGEWVEEINANKSDTVRFRCIIHNDGGYNLTNITVTDILSDSLEYADNATVDDEPQEPIKTDNKLEWDFTGPLEPCKNITIEFDAIAIKCGIDVNWQNATGYCNETQTWVCDNDSAIVNVTGYGVNLTVDKPSERTSLGENATYTLTLNNTGCVQDNYTLSVDNPDGAAVANLSTYSITNLAAGATETVLLNVTDAIAGTYQVNVTATSGGDPTKTDSVNTTTTVGNIKGDININEIMYNTTGTESWYEWIELYNNDSKEIDVSGWVLNGTIGGSDTILSGTMSIGEYIVLAKNVSAFQERYPDVTCTIIKGNWSALSNTHSETINLFGSTSALNDTVTYELIATENYTLERDATDTWKESRVDGGTPCEVNSVCYPTVTVRYPNGGETFTIGEEVNVSANATDDVGVEGVVFYYTNDSGLSWNSIGSGALVSGTNTSGTWNISWNTTGLTAGTNYSIKANATDGVLTAEDESNSTFTLTPALMEGDVNLDNCVGLKDSTLIKLYLVGKKTLDEDQKKCADTKDDDAVTLKDSTFIKKWLVDDTTPLWESPADDDMLEPVAC